MNDSVPNYLAPYLLTGSTAIITVLLFGLARALRRASWQTKERATVLWSAFLVLVGWLLVAIATSLARFYAPQSGAPTIQYGVLGPIVIGVLLFRSWPLLRRALDAVPQEWIVRVQFYRVLGVIFLILYAGRLLPGIFALPAGLGDTLVGILAPFVAVFYARSPEAAARRVRLWNLLGITDLVIAVTLGFLTSPSPLQIAAFDRPSGLIATFPLAVIPVFAVPLSILLHFASLHKLRQAEQRSNSIGSLAGVAKEPA